MLRYVTLLYFTFIKSHYITSHHIISHHIILHSLHYITLYYIILYYIILYYIILYYIILYYIILYYIILYYIILTFNIPYTLHPCIISIIDYINSCSLMMILLLLFQNKIIPRVLALARENNYLHRMTTLFAINVRSFQVYISILLSCMSRNVFMPSFWTRKLP